jgi:hypothetical protein
LLAFLALKPIKYLLIGTLILSTLIGGYYIWKNNVEYQARLEYNNQQMRRVIEEQREYSRQQSVMLEEQQRLARELLTANENLERRLNNVNTRLSSSEVIANDQLAPEIIRQTIIQLRDEVR